MSPKSALLCDSIDVRHQMVELADFRDGSDYAVLVCRDGAAFRTGDSLGMVYTLEKGSEQHEAVTVGDESIMALACKPGGGEYAVAHNTTLGIYSGDLQTQKLGMAVRRTLMITHVDYDVGGHHVFVASQEPDIQVFNTLLQSVEFTLRTKNVGVRMFRQSADGSKLAVLDENGAVTIYGLVVSSGAGGVRSFGGSDSLTTISDVVSKDAVRAYTKNGSSVSWHPTAAKLAVPSVDGSLMVFSQNSMSSDGTEWDEELFVMSDDDENRHSAAAIMVQWSPNGKFLASADMDGTVLVWDTAEKEAIAKHMCGEALCDMAWGQEESDNYLLVVSTGGSAFIDAVVPTDRGSPTARVVAAAAAPASVAAGTDVVLEATQLEEESAAATITVEKTAAADADANEGEGEGETSTTKRKSGWSAAFGASAEAVGDKGTDKKGALPGDLDLGGKDDDDENDVGTSMEALKASLMARPEGQGEDENFDEDASAAGDALDGASGEEGEDTEEVVTVTPAVILQRAFQPSSTLPDEKRRRFMVWNAFGHVVSRDDRMSKRVDMTLRPSANPTGRPFEKSFTDNHGFTKGSIGPQGAAFADDRGKSAEMGGLTKDDKGATIFYYAFSGYQTNETFTTNLPQDEGVDALAVGSGWVAVATTKGLLRVFSTTGLQLFMSWLKGPVVALVGTGMQLAIVYHAAAPINESFNLRADMLEFGPETCFRQLAEVRVPLSPGSKLDWLGFCPNTNFLAVADSEGVVSVLMKSCGWQWMPVLDCQAVRKNHEDYYWPICIVDGCFEYALLKGVSKPPVFPLPVTASKEFAVPVALATGARGSTDLQNDRWRAMMWEQAQATHAESVKAELDSLLVLPEGYSLVDLEDRVAFQAASADTAVLKLLQEACRLQKTALGFDLAKRLRTEKACQAAIKIANHFGKPALAFALEDTLRYKQNMARAMADAQDEAEEAEAEAAQHVMYTHAARRTGPNTSVSPEAPAEWTVSGRTAALGAGDPGVGMGMGSQLSSSTDGSAIVTPGEQGTSRRSVTFSDDVEPPFSPTRENVNSNQGSPSPGGKRLHNKFARALGKTAPSGLFSPKRDRDVHLTASASPSPNKTPKLLRQSSYAEEARSNMKQRMSTDGYI
jgi:chromosome transmission fidelity protein 4